MKKAFEKILERLDNAIKECKELQRNTDDAYGYMKMKKGLVCAKGIVEEVSEEYNGGWIPCSEGLPEEHKLYDITFKNDAGIHSDSAIYNPYLKRWLWDADETELVENEVLAWADKREPYQPKGE